MSATEDTVKKTALDALNRHFLLNHAAQDRIVSTAEYERINLRSQICEISLGYRARDSVVGPAFFGQRHEQRASTFNNFGSRVH